MEKCGCEIKSGSGLGGKAQKCIVPTSVRVCYTGTHTAATHSYVPTTNNKLHVTLNRQGKLYYCSVNITNDYTMAVTLSCGAGFDKLW